MGTVDFIFLYVDIVGRDEALLRVSIVRLFLTAQSANQRLSISNEALLMSRESSGVRDTTRLTTDLVMKYEDPDQHQNALMSSQVNSSVDKVSDS